MVDTLPSHLVGWESFYVIVGSSGAALTGLQFVVIALVAESQRRSSIAEISAFGTPTVVHFCAALLVSAMLSAPWPALSMVAVLLGLIGATGVGYVALVLRRARMQKGYKPVSEDWLWHIILPFVAYFAFMIAGVFLASRPVIALFGVGAMSILLIFIGIHNSWDTVTYLAVAQPAGPQTDESQPPSSS
jgi:hypothetical protein